MITLRTDWVSKYVHRTMSVFTTAPFIIDFFIPFARVSARNLATRHDGIKKRVGRSFRLFGSRFKRFCSEELSRHRAVFVQTNKHEEDPSYICRTNCAKFSYLKPYIAKCFFQPFLTPSTSAYPIRTLISNLSILMAPLMQIHGQPDSVQHFYKIGLKTTGRNLVPKSLFGLLMKAGWSF